MGGRAWQSAQPDTLEYWKLLTELYANEPVAPRDRVMFGMLRSLGIAPGAPFNPDARQTRILTDAAKVDELMPRTGATLASLHDQLRVTVQSECPSAVDWPAAALHEQVVKKQVT